MLKQSTAPIPFGATRRMDNTSGKTSGPAGVSIPFAVAPLFRGDSCAGRVTIGMELAEMPKPLENAVIARVQAWFNPRTALPHFEGIDEYTHAYHGKTISRIGESARNAPALFDTVGTGAIAAAQASEFFKALGISLQATTAINTDYIDTYVNIYNFRLASHSSKMANADYYQENATTSLELKPAFWPRNRMHDIVPDYEQALVKGSLDLDVTAGQIPVSGIGVGISNTYPTSSKNIHQTGGSGTEVYADSTVVTNATADMETMIQEDPNNAGYPGIWAEMTGQTIPTTLADLDKARTTQAFAKALAAMDGADFSGYNNDDVIVAELMQGFQVPSELYQRPWLLDSKTVVFGMNERHATDAANLDDSMTTGRAQVTLSVNIPRVEYGGIFMATVEVMPERLYERQSDEYLYCTTPEDLPNAIRDLQRTEPVDSVVNRRVDVLHATPAGIFGYEPMNAKWEREFTRFGGEFRQLVPGTPATGARTAIWQADYVDPAFTSDHWLCPHPFPQGVFSAPSNDIVNISYIQNLTITGITQKGEALVEDNSEFTTVETEQSQ